MSAAAVSFRGPLLPWAVAPEDEARFRRILHRVLAAVTLLCLALLLMPRPVEDRAAPVELPARLAKLVLEQKPLTPPSPPAATRADRPPEAQLPVPKTPAPEARRPDEPTRSAAASLKRRKRRSACRNDASCRYSLGSRCAERLRFGWFMVQAGAPLIGDLNMVDNIS